MLGHETSPKFWTLRAGLFLPLVSQAMVSMSSVQLCMLEDKIPAMYWNGMGSEVHPLIPHIHWLWVPLLMLLAAILGILPCRFCTGTTIFRPIDLAKLGSFVLTLYPAIMCTGSLFSLSMSVTRTFGLGSHSKRAPHQNKPNSACSLHNNNTIQRAFGTEISGNRRRNAELLSEVRAKCWQQWKLGRRRPTSRTDSTAIGEPSTKPYT
jgi:hypothetical protein